MRRTVPTRSLYAVWLLLAVAGCGAPSPSRPSPKAAAAEGPPPLTTFYFECEDGTSVVAHHEEAADEVWLFLPGATRRLKRERSASGARYTDGTVSYGSEGREATIDRGDGPVRCEENRRRSTFEDAKLRGMDFRGVGNEPGWTLEIGPETLVFTTNYGQDTYRFDAPPPQTDPVARETFYRTENDGHALVVRLSVGENRCPDSMSDETFETRVEVTLDGTRYSGCGNALH